MKKIIFPLLAFLLPFIFYGGIFFGRSFGLECAGGMMGGKPPYQQTITQENVYCSYIIDVGAYAWNHYPLWVKAANAYIHLQFPLWNQNNGIGIPLAADFLSSAYFIPNMFFALFNSVLAFDIYFVFRMAIASLGMYLFLRTFKIPNIPSLIGSLIIFLNGYVVQLPTISHHNVDILLPWIAYFINKAFFERKIKYFVLLALVTGLSHLGGMPESSVFIALFFVLYTGFLSLFIAKNDEKLHFSLAFFLSFFMSFLLASILIIPGYEYITFAASPHQPGALQPSSIPFSYIIFWPFPSIFGPIGQTGNFKQYLGPANWYGNYIGAFSSWLLVVSFLLVIFKRKKLRRNLYFKHYLFFLFVFVFLVLQYFHLLPNIISLLPGFSQTTFTKYSLSLINLLVAAVVPFTIFYVIKIRSRSILVISTIFMIFLAAVVYISFKQPILSIQMYPHFLKQLILSTAVVILSTILLFFKDLFKKKTSILYLLLFFIAAFELFFYLPHKGDMKRRDSFRKPPAIKYLQSLDYQSFRIFSPDYILHPNLSAIFNINDVRNLEPLWIRSYYSYLSLFVTDPVNYRFTGEQELGATKSAQFVNNVFFDLLSVKYLLSYRNIDNQQFKRIYEKEMKIYENTHFIPRLHPVSATQCASKEDEVIKKMKIQENNMRNIGIVLSSDCTLHAFKTEEIQLTNQKFDDQKVSFTYESPHESYLVLSNSFYPGWKFKIEGKEFPIDRVNYAFQGLYLPQGNNLHVEIVYDPISFKIGFMLTIISLLTCCFIFIFKGNEKV